MASCEFPDVGLMHGERCANSAGEGRRRGCEDWWVCRSSQVQFTDDTRVMFPFSQNNPLANALSSQQLYWVQIQRAALGVVSVLQFSDPHPLHRWGKCRNCVMSFKELPPISQLSALSRLSFCICCKSFPLPVGLGELSRYFISFLSAQTCAWSWGKDSRSCPCQTFILLPPATR